MSLPSLEEEYEGDVYGMYCSLGELFGVINGPSERFPSREVMRFHARAIRNLLSPMDDWPASLPHPDEHN
jgi:hypothetical protein